MANDEQGPLLLLDFDSELSEATKRTYTGTLKLLATLLGFNPYSLNEFRERMNTADESYDVIKGRWPNPATRCRVLTTILACLRLTHSTLEGRALTTWKHIHWVLTRNTSRKNGKLSGKEALAWVPFSEIVAKRVELARSEFGSMRHLFLAWYTLWPPNRADFGQTLVFRRESDVPEELRRWMYYRSPELNNGVVKSRPIAPVLKGGAKGGAVHSMSMLTRSRGMPEVNFVVLQPSTPREWHTTERPEYVEEWDKAPRLVILDHKTANTRGRILRALPLRLAEVLEASLHDLPRQFLFVRDDALMFNSAHSFTVWGERVLEKLFDGRRLGFNGLRHSYISNVDNNLSSPQQLATLARDMGHSEFMQRRYARGVFREGRAPVLKEPDDEPGFDARRFHALKPFPKGLNLQGRYGL